MTGNLIVSVLRIVFITFFFLAFIVGNTYASNQEIIKEEYKDQLQNFDTCNRVNLMESSKTAIVFCEDDSKKMIHIEENNKVLCLIMFLKFYDRMNPSVTIESTASGFTLIFEWGSRFYQSRRFNFLFIDKICYLSFVEVTCFDKHNPEIYINERKKHFFGIEIFKIDIEDFLFDEECE